MTVRCTDLKGFWDMVDFQVVDVTNKFKHLQKVKHNNYVQIEYVPEQYTAILFYVSKNYVI